MLHPPRSSIIYPPPSRGHPPLAKRNKIQGPFRAISSPARIPAGISIVFPFLERREPNRESSRPVNRASRSTESPIPDTYGERCWTLVV